MNDYYEHIEEYIEGNLSIEDQNEFEGEMLRDPHLAESVKNFHLAKKLSASLIEDETRQSLKKIKSKPNSNISYFLIIATILILVFLLSYFFYKKKKELNLTDENQIFAQLYELPASLGSRNESKLITSLDSAIYYFDQRKTDDSKIIFEKLIESDSLNPLIIKYIANIHLLNSSYSESETYFVKLLSLGSESQIKEAEYNLIIIYIIQKKKMEAKKIFNSLKTKNIISDKKIKIMNEYINKL